MEYTVRIHKNGSVIERKVLPGVNLLDFLRDNSFDVASPCGGRGTCGKCRVKVTGLMEEPSQKEKHVIGNSALSKGYRLACYNNINSDIDLYMDEKDDEAKIATDARERNIRLNPIVKKKFVTLKTPAIDDQISDIDRIAKNMDGATVAESIDLLRELPDAMRLSDYKVTLGCFDDRVVFVEEGDTTQILYGVAVDVGTTTIAAYLIDISTGIKLDVYSALNPQRKFGADVLSRIDYTLRSDGLLSEMNDSVVNCINNAIEFFCARNNIEYSNIYAVVLVGNTTMMHFLMKLSAKNIATAPFIPVTTRLHKFRAKELGIKINHHGYAVIFPCVSAYIGADTIAAVLSSGMYENENISLLIDIGTNGEIVLGNNEWLYSCSTAAGPAFEGANIRNGVGGVKGSIDRVSLNPELHFTTIGNAEAIGICGSGIVDAVAAMLEAGVIDETGRIVSYDDDEYDALSDELKNRIVDIDGMSAFLLVKSEKCAADIDIAITQKDVRELQNAKAAIAAGIKVLVKHAGIEMKDIGRVYLAGGFGSYINIDSALKIGLLPEELRGRIESIGNAAGAGAIEGLISVDLLGKTEEIKNNMKYIELSAQPDFVDEYVECMMF